MQHQEKEENTQLQTPEEEEERERERERERGREGGREGERERLISRKLSFLPFPEWQSIRPNWQRPSRQLNGIRDPLQ